jgi:hypothetical protein
MHTKYLVLIAAALALFGCSTVDQSTTFDEAAFGPYASPGTAVIHGHAFAHTDDARIFVAAGLNVYLVPLTTYTDEMAKIMQRNKIPSPADPRLEKYTKATIADIAGNFEFDGLPAGSYVVYCRIQWARPRLNSFGDYYIAGEAVVAEKETKHLVVTNVIPFY